VGLGADPQNRGITEAIIAMARALSLTVIGEGAETAVQLDELRRVGCDQVQGFYYSPPTSPEAITAMLRDGPPWKALRRSSRGTHAAG
jgi:EAL domain-containing protein (putative c-di-GMP-specific phosphodiesterase class I)